MSAGQSKPGSGELFVKQSRAKGMGLSAKIEKIIINASESFSAVGPQSMRHLNPANLTLLKDGMKDQLLDLKGVNTLGSPRPPYVHKPGSDYSRTLLTTTRPK